LQVFLGNCRVEHREELVFKDGVESPTWRTVLVSWISE